jgi:ABC-type nitrate/sulfonate/bicarbonate transport system substrate-binding protein
VKSPIPVRIAYAALGSGSTPVWTAKEAGLFADEGLDAELALIRGSGQVSQALMANDIHFANIAAPLVVRANLKGGDLVYLTGGVNWIIQSIITRPEIQEPAQLRGRTMGTGRSGGVDDFLIPYLLKPHGLTLGVDIKTRAIDNQPDSIAKLDRGEIDGALFSPPYSFEAMKRGYRVLIDGGRQWIDYQLGGIVARRAYVEQNPDVTMRVVRGYVRGIHRYKRDPDFVVGVLRKYSLIQDENVARQCYAAAGRYFQPKPYPTVPGIHRVLEEAAKIDSAARNIRVEDMMDSRWIAELDNNGFIRDLYSAKGSNGSDLFATLRAALDEASRTKRGQLVLAGHDEDFQLEIPAHAPIHVEFRSGQLAVHPGPSPRQEPLHFTRVGIDEPTLSSILAGTLSPVEAMEQGKLFLRTRLYGGALITILLRSAYDLALQRALGQVRQPR